MCTAKTHRRTNGWGRPPQQPKKTKSTWRGEGVRSERSITSSWLCGAVQPAASPRQESASAPRLESSPTPFLTHLHATGTKNNTRTPSWKSREATECIARRGGPPQQGLPPAPLERELGTRGRLRATLSKRHTVKALPRPREPRAPRCDETSCPFHRRLSAPTRQ